MATLGSYTLLAAFVACAYAAAAAVAGHRRHSARLLESGIGAFYLVTALDVRTTLALILEMNFIAYLLLRKYGGPGSDKLAAGLALFGMFNVPIVYLSVNVWRTLHPPTTVVPKLPLPCNRRSSRNSSRSTSCRKRIACPRRRSSSPPTRLSGFSRSGISGYCPGDSPR